MKVKDKRTGNILESKSDVVTDGWKAHPGRFIPLNMPQENPPKESGAAEENPPKPKRGRK